MDPPRGAILNPVLLIVPVDAGILEVNPPQSSEPLMATSLPDWTTFRCAVPSNSTFRSEYRGVTGPV